MIRRAIAFGALLVAACSHEVPPPQHMPEPPATAKAAPAPQKVAGENVLATQPQIAPLPQFDAPVPRIEKLPNGLTAYIIERPGDGLEAVQLWVRGGASADPAKLPGLQSVLAALMETGAAGKSQTELAEAADAIGMTLSVQATQEAFVVSGSAMTTRLEAMTKLLADVALRPTLAEAEWTKVRQQREAAVVAQRAEPAVAASRAFRAAAFAGTPFAHAIIGDLNSIRAMKLSDLKRVYAGFGPQGSALVAVGGAKADDVLALLRAQFGGWRTKGAAQRVPQAAAPADRPRLVLVDYPGKPQSVLVVGQPTVPRSSPDYLPLELMNAVLGGSFTSRLNQNLREQHGYSYGAASALQWGVSLTPFIARASVKTDVTGAALKETLDELQRAPELEPAELEKGRALLAFGLVEHFSSATALAGLAAEIWLYGLPPDELRTYVPRLRAVTTQSVQAAAQRDLAPAKMTIVIAGDTEKVQPQLAPLSLGPPQMRDAMGDLARK